MWNNSFHGDLDINILAMKYAYISFEDLVSNTIMPNEHLYVYAIVI